MKKTVFCNVRRFALGLMAAFGGVCATTGHATDDAGNAAVVASLRDVDLSFPAEASVEAVRQATVAAQISGRVLSLSAEVGQRVKRGDVLLRIDPREVAGVDAGAQASLAQARATYERSKNLLAQKFISQAAFDQADAVWKAAQGTAGVSGASLSHAAVTAPMDGVIAVRSIELGELASPGRPLMTIYDPRGLRAIAAIPQYKLAEVRKSGRAKVEFTDTGVWVDAVRVEILPTVDVRSHTATARVYLPDNLPGVVPGMFARVHFATGQARKLTLPAAAILRRGEVTGVFVLDEQGRARLRQVRLGESVIGGDIEILAGINPGDRVSLTPVKTGIEQKR